MSKKRRQRVTLRFRHREDLKHRIRKVLVKSVVIALFAGFAAGMVAGHDTVFIRFLHRHTPSVQLSLPQPLTGLPVVSQLPKNSFWLWMPGSEFFLRKRLARQFTAVRSARMERYFKENRIVIHVDPRIPLVSWNGSGLDQDGILFAMTPGAWKTLPVATFAPRASRTDLGRWLLRLSEVPALWSQVSAIRQDAYGTLELSLKTGAVVIWGPLDAAALPRKLPALVRVLDDAHEHLGGAASADLRFFDQGRIIVRPKTASITNRS